MDLKTESTAPVLPPPERKSSGDRRSNAATTQVENREGGGRGGEMSGEEDGGGGAEPEESGGTTTSTFPASAQHGRGLSRDDSGSRPGLKGMTSLDGTGRRRSKDDTPPSTPPPRPPPPRRPPSIEEMREKEKILQRMSSIPAYYRSDSIGSSPRGSRGFADRHLSMNGSRNLSLDQSGSYSASREHPSSSGDKNIEELTDSSEQCQKQSVETVSKRMEGVSMKDGIGGGRESNSVRPVEPPARQAKGDASVTDPTTATKTCTQSNKPKNHTTYAKTDQTDASTMGGSYGGNEVKLRTQESTRAPKITTTKRRSSTVDEMLFDDYVEPEVNKNVESAYVQECLPQDLMSFDVSPNKKPGDAPDDLASPASVDSSEAEYGESAVPRSASQMSDRSWSSTYSLDSQPDDLTVECMEFMKAFVDKIFNAEEETTQVEKAKFGELCQCPPGRLWFARYVNSQRVNNKRVTEETLFRLVQYFAVCLFECHEAEDFSPAKTLMNMCFTFFCDMPSPGGEDKSFLYMFLKEQPIWQSLRFWNAAFFDAVQCERSRRPTATNSAANDTMTDDRNFQENITFGQLGTFSCNMRSFGLSRELCLEFLRKQSTIANLSREQVQLLRENVDKMKE